MSWKQIWAACGAVALAAFVDASAGAQPSAQAGPQASPPAALSSAQPSAQGRQRPAAQGSGARQGAQAATQPASAAPPPAGPSGESVVAVVNDEVISTYDVRQRALLLLLQSQFQPTPEIMRQASAQALHDLIDEHLQLQETGGDPYKIHITDAEVDRRLADVARSNNTTVQELTRRLTEGGVNVNTLRTQIKADMAWNRLMSGLYGSRIRISDAEVRETLARIAANASGTHYQVSEIFIPANTPTEMAQAQDGALRLLEQIGQCRCFDRVAHQFSASPSAANGGDIGWVAASELQPEVANVIQHLQPGQVSNPVRTSTGVYIVALRDKREGVPQGSTTQVTLREISAPGARRQQLERLSHRIAGCATIDREITSIEGAQSTDLGQTSEADLSPEIRNRINGLATGAASPVVVSGDQVNTIVVCSRDTGGAGVPSRDEIENRLFEQQLSMLSDRYLRNLRSEATIIQR